MNGNSHQEPSRYANHLMAESSPYLLAHARNPVDWYPWSEEALKKARDEDKPIFLSIGYAACHWCHVMEKESFENEAIAAILNEFFVSIKVDREQRPDLDQIYMTATTAMTGFGGWPLSIFLTPDLKPFFAGTYFPPDDRRGRPGFRYIISELARGFKEDRGNIENMASRITDILKENLYKTAEPVDLDRRNIALAVRALMNNYDAVAGGFGGAPKFPHPVALSFMLQEYSLSGDRAILEAVEKSLINMARGGIYDHLAGGFHRYATDSRWLIPHFEKMLYDNALLTETYSDAYRITGSEVYRRIVVETLDFILQEMTDKEGGFYSSLDADSEGREGEYYTWEKGEIDGILGSDSESFCKYYNISDSGNFEHNRNVLNVDAISDRFRDSGGSDAGEFELMIQKGKRRLLEARYRRNRPLTDDKIISSWNGLALSGLAAGYQITRDDRYKNAAVEAAEFIIKNLYRDGVLFHSVRNGKISDGEFLEDYAFLIKGLLDLYEITYDFRWIEISSALAKQALKKFSDKAGNFYLAPHNPGSYFIRPKEIHDGATPAPGSIMILGLLKLTAISGDMDLAAAAERALKILSEEITSNPFHMISALWALSFHLSSHTEIVLVGEPERHRFLDVIYKGYIPHRILIVSDHGQEKSPLLEGRHFSGKTTAYICRESVCSLPLLSPADLSAELERPAHP